MKTKIVIPLAIVVAVIIWLAVSWFSKISQPPVAYAIESFAACLGDKGVTMYGAEWCPHCQNQKNLFGEAFSKVPYIECPEHTSECIAKKIDGYPTWIFQDGSRLIGEQSFEALSVQSGCELKKIQ